MFGSYFIVENRDLVGKNGFFLHIVKRGIPKMNFDREFFFLNTEVLKIIRNGKKSRDFEDMVYDFEIT